ncbi:GerMN domain-containing protein [Fictibacillus sp. WQ 8-8]|uniref:GerMN domain-containing protein n=1 Tax=Fictibacillus sp. WQ 8-8 TaxID=2938788 RepID=UPI00210BECDF|nr:GerMN domain-containing protein [Fictibacillus sp. WQ 8-8]MCQ6266488.1 GerMN domain-containing protein [Fictibacillus sp. WQ 8-8]
MYKKMRAGAPLLLLSVSMLMAGCGLGGEKAGNELDPPKVNYVKEGKSLDKETTAKATKNSVKRQLFLLDSNGLVVPQMMNLPKSGTAAKQVLEYLVKDGPVSNILPNGFQAVLPPDTQVLDVVVGKDGTATANFSKEFKDYRGQDEQRLLQSITFTLTQFHSIKNVKIQIDGKNQDVMPVNHTPINDGVSRADGINIENGNVVDMTGSDTATLYFVAENGTQEYYVPVTRRVVKNDSDKITAAIQELIQGPGEQSRLLTGFRNDVKLLDAPVVKKGVATLNFNKAILDNKSENTIDDAVLKSIVLSLTELNDVKKVAIHVNGKTKLKSEDGKSITAPVSRPAIVNTGEF